MDREQLNRIRPGGAEEWKQRRAQSSNGEQPQFLSQPPAGENTAQTPAGERKAAPVQAPAGERKAAPVQAPAGERKASPEQNPNEKLKRSYLVKLLAMLVLVGILVVFTTIAWFTMNKETGSSGMGVKVGGQNFEVTNISGSRDGIFKNPHHIAVHEEGALYWQVTASNNLINYDPYVDEEHPGDQGIHPGTEGVISFNVIPKTDSVSLEFDFEIIGYQASIDDKSTVDPEDDELVMTALSDLPDSDGTTAQNMLNGHILLFEHRSGTAGSYVYSTPICSNADMHRIMSRTVTGQNTENQIDIYWVWPNTLSTIVDARASGVTTVPFCEDDDTYQYDSYSAIIENVEEYPHYYLKGASSNDSINAVNDIGLHYASYGDMYDQGDNEIGMRVHYILIKLSVTEGAAGGGGS